MKWWGSWHHPIRSPANVFWWIWLTFVYDVFRMIKDFADWMNDFEGFWVLISMCPEIGFHWSDCSDRRNLFFIFGTYQLSEDHNVFQKPLLHLHKIWTSVSHHPNTFHELVASALQQDSGLTIESLGRRCFLGILGHLAVGQYHVPCCSHPMNEPSSRTVGMLGWLTLIRGHKISLEV